MCSFFRSALRISHQLPDISVDEIAAIWSVWKSCLSVALEDSPSTLNEGPRGMMMREI